MHCSILLHLLYLTPFLPLLLAASIPYPPPSLPFQAPLHHVRHRASHPSIFNKLRDAVIQAIWEVPSRRQDCNAKSKPKSTTAESSTPQTLLARYGGDVVLRFNITSHEEAKALSEAANVLFLDVWEFNTEWVDIRLGRDVVTSLLGLLPKSLQHAHTPLMHDLAQSIYESLPSPAFADLSPPEHVNHPSFGPSLHSSPDETNLFFRDYQPLSVIVPWMRLLQSLFPTHVRMVNLGTSFEGRDIQGLRVGAHPTNSERASEHRKTVIITGGSHAREWIGTAAVNYAAYSLITAYGRDKSMTKLVEEFDWVFIPILNPDGYVYTWENDRLWRKNRQNTNLRFCKGLDLDRTFSFEWDGETTEGNPCSESFAGEFPFQAVESARFANWVKNETMNNNATITGYLDLHSYSQQILYPFSYSCAVTPPTLENLEELGLGLAKAVHQASGELYGVTSACEGSVAPGNQRKRDRKLWPRIESIGGTALDWMYHDMQAKYAYQIKLRDNGNYGFLLPSKHIVPTGEEVFSAVTFFGKYLLSNHGIETIDESPSSEDVKIPVSRPQDPDSRASPFDDVKEEADAGSSWELRRRR